MVTRRLKPGEGDEVEHGEVTEVWFDRDYREVWNRWGDKSVVPADAVFLVDLLAQGWTLYPPQHPEERPRGKKMRDGSTFLYAVTANDVSPAERARMNRNPAELLAQANLPAPAAPTATYYSPQGDAYEWPADPVSMKGYFELGFSLKPPAAAKAPAPVKKQPSGAQKRKAALARKTQAAPLEDGQGGSSGIS